MEQLLKGIAEIKEIDKKKFEIDEECVHRFIKNGFEEHLKKFQ